MNNMNNMNNTQVIEKPMTRQEYYTNMGFSGSKIDRPDDLVDDAFKKHCEGLRKIAEGFIDFCKKTEDKRLLDKEVK